MQDLGGGPTRGTRPRSQAVIDATAHIIYLADADVTAIIEVRRKHVSAAPPNEKDLYDGPSSLSKTEWAAFTYYYGPALQEAFEKGLSPKTEKGKWAAQQLFSLGLMTDGFKLPKSKSDSVFNSSEVNINKVRAFFAKGFREMTKVFYSEMEKFLKIVYRSKYRSKLNELRKELEKEKVKSRTLGTIFEKDQDTWRHPGALGYWLKFWSWNEEYDDDPGPLLRMLSDGKPDEDWERWKIELDRAVLGRTDEPPSPELKAEAVRDKGKEKGKRDDDDTANRDTGEVDHLGFREIERIVAALNTLAGENVYASMPTLEEVQAACEENRPKYYYTHNESYAFIYRRDRCGRAGIVPPAGIEKPTDFELLQGFEYRAPGSASFVFGTAKISLIAHHPPAENSSSARPALRAREFRAVEKLFVKIRKTVPSTLTFYLADTNADTSGALTDCVPMCNRAFTNIAFLRMLSDDPGYAERSLFAHARTSHRRTQLRGTPGDLKAHKPLTEGAYAGRKAGSLTNALRCAIENQELGAEVGKKIEKALSSAKKELGKLKEKSCDSEAERRRVATAYWNIAILEMRLRRRKERVAVLASRFLGILRRYEDAFSSRAKAFDKIAVVLGHPHARVTRECVIPLLYAVAPRSLTDASKPIQSLLFPEVDPQDRFVNAISAYLGELAQGVKGVPPAEELSQPVSYKAAKSALARVTQLVAIVNTVSDHAPCLAEYSVILPADYEALADSQRQWPPPRQLHDNAAGLRLRDFPVVNESLLDAAGEATPAHLAAGSAASIGQSSTDEGALEEYAHELFKEFGAPPEKGVKNYDDYDDIDEEGGSDFESSTETTSEEEEEDEDSEEGERKRR